MLTLPVMFPSQGDSLSGVFYRNTGVLDKPQPAVIVTGSWLTVKEQMAETYARRLAELGYTTFVFDFAGFGQSSGSPRQTEIPVLKIANIRDAAEFVSSMSFVRSGAVGHLGICASAQYTLAAIAQGAKIAAFVSVAGWYHDANSVASFYGGAEGVAARLAESSAALDSIVTSGVVSTVPAYEAGNPKAGMFLELAYYAKRERGAIPAWTNAMSPMSWFHWLTFDGLRCASDVSVPTLFVHSDGCVFPANAKSVFERLRGKKKMLWTEGTQTDFYDLSPFVDKAIAAADEHFSETLKAEADAAIDRVRLGKGYARGERQGLET